MLVVNAGARFSDTGAYGVGEVLQDEGIPDGGSVCGFAKRLCVVILKVGRVTG